MKTKGDKTHSTDRGTNGKSGYQRHDEAGHGERVPSERGRAPRQEEQTYCHGDGHVGSVYNVVHSVVDK